MEILKKIKVVKAFLNSERRAFSRGGPGAIHASNCIERVQKKPIFSSLGGWTMIQCFKPSYPHSLCTPACDLIGLVSHQFFVPRYFFCPDCNKCITNIVWQTDFWKLPGFWLEMKKKKFEPQKANKKKKEGLGGWIDGKTDKEMAKRSKKIERAWSLQLNNSSTTDFMNIPLRERCPPSLGSKGQDRWMAEQSINIGEEKLKELAVLLFGFAGSIAFMTRKKEEKLQNIKNSPSLT